MFHMHVFFSNTSPPVACFSLLARNLEEIQLISVFLTLKKTVTVLSVSLSLNKKPDGNMNKNKPEKNQQKIRRDIV